MDWYYRHLRGRDLPIEELAKFSSPPYWGHYVYHDNNRDGMQLTLALTRAIHGAYYQYRPQVVHDLHESLPLLYISTGHGPYSRAIDPVTVNEWTQFAHHEVSELQSQGAAGRVGLGASGMAGGPATSFPWPTITTASVASTKPSATPWRAPSSAISPKPGLSANR